jgi:large subunit ribosomal protein L30
MSATSGRIRVRQVRSGACCPRDQKATLVALGLGRIGKERVHPDNPQIRGMVYKVTHLVTVEGEGAAEPSRRLR